MVSPGAACTSPPVAKRSRCRTSCACTAERNAASGRPRKPDRPPGALSAGQGPGRCHPPPRPAPADGGSRAAGASRPTCCPARGSTCSTCGLTARRTKHPHARLPALRTKHPDGAHPHPRASPEAAVVAWEAAGRGWHCGSPPEAAYGNRTWHPQGYPGCRPAAAAVAEHQTFAAAAAKSLDVLPDGEDARSVADCGAPVEPNQPRLAQGAACAHQAASRTTTPRRTPRRQAKHPIVSLAATPAEAAAPPKPCADCCGGGADDVSAEAPPHERQHHEFGLGRPVGCCYLEQSRKRKSLHPLCRTTCEAKLKMCDTNARRSHHICWIMRGTSDSMVGEILGRSIPALALRPQPRGDTRPFAQLPHLVAGVPIHLTNGVLEGNPELMDHEDETSNLAEELSKTQQGLSGDPPDTCRHVCSGSISQKRG